MLKSELKPTSYKSGTKIVRAMIRRPMSDRWNPVVYLYEDESVMMKPKKLSCK